MANPTIYSLSQFLFYSCFSCNHNAFLVAISSIGEQTNFYQAMKHAHWWDVMAKENLASEENKTWVFSELPLGKQAIDSKWVYKIKYNPDGSVEQHKVYLVAKGYTQIEGVDFDEIFA